MPTAPGSEDARPGPTSISRSWLVSNEFDFRWMQPAGSAPVESWRFFRAGELVLEVSGPIPDPAGVYVYPAPPWPEWAEYHMTAVNQYGESPPSNTLLLPEPPASWGIAATLLMLVLLHRRRER